MLNLWKQMSKIKNNISVLIWVVFIFILLPILFNTNYKHNLIKFLGGYTTKDTIKISIDTLDIKIDTTRIINNWIEVNADLFEPIIIDNTKDSIVYKDSIIYLNNGIIYDYKNSITDSLLFGYIHTSIDYGNKKILAQNLVYKPKFPIIITKTIPILKTIETNTYNNYKIGGGFDINSLGDIGIIGAYQNNKGLQYTITYELNNSIPNNSLRFGIIKFF